MVALFINLINLPLHAVIIRGASDPNFRGFLIQARTCADDTPVGIFIVPNSEYQGVCTGNVCYFFADNVFCIIILANVPYFLM